jgi:L-seryl-tRNA(Ser) seleniumtransferase
MHSPPVVVAAIQAVLEEYRKSLRPGDAAPGRPEILACVEQRLQQTERARQRPVVNATGIILHTGLGRAVLPQRAVDALAGLNRCCNLQIDLETGWRGKRDFMCAQLLMRLTGAEAATVVNNNAAATLLILSALAKDKEVVISRGQLIEIGGSFRLPDCIDQSGARMVEVGTTNKTHLRDYENALTENTAMVLRVNPSNYRVVGFSKEVPIADLVSLKQKRPVIVVDDLGCGALLDLSAYGLPKEATVQESIAAGADLVCFSGDKLIGGPQAGIIVGRKELIEKIEKHPLSRMLRVGKMTDLALEHTLRLFLDPSALIEQNPTWWMLTRPAEMLRGRAEAMQRALEAHGTALRLRVTASESATGGGSLPAVAIPSYALAVRSSRETVDELSRRLRAHEPPVIARIVADEVLIDLRTLLVGEDVAVLEALKKLG